MKDSSYAILKVEEVIDNMTQALTGLAKSLNKTKAMVDCIKSTKRAEEFKADCEEMMKAHDAKQKEYEALLEHRNLLKEFIDSYKAADDDKKAIMAQAVLTIFVVFNVIHKEELEEK